MKDYVDWYEFYRPHVSSPTYQLVFKTRYREFLEYVASRDIFFEEIACGIGSASKYLCAEGLNCIMTDIDIRMCGLANRNTVMSGTHSWIKNAVTGEFLFAPPALFPQTAISTNFLQYLEWKDVKQTINVVKKEGRRSIHMVPTDKYDLDDYDLPGKPYFRSEEEYLRELNPDYSFTFNDGLDLVLEFDV